ncbi:hypothetical protein BC936DRAFT_142777 [Jimgerdemannia flammicorona]|uniref:Uncharacterized protein n=2 Tax=Jimgerdemannia flammicorona TaxID=994334 RepID=A0A433QTT8_9FUNG|nr:hypothetical protein BC936DRAFT_142777 [Jimgerdemannia flammicorona]RUS33204.1 hypothetical protein BC938DRAFT_472654 [Jimgerdemannia flammicorona]
MDVLNIAKPLLLDGGLATELERSHNKDLSGHLWSAQFLKDDPNAIKVIFSTSTLNSFDN